jgi:hypothetical protein
MQKSWQSEKERVKNKVTTAVRMWNEERTLKNRGSAAGNAEATEEETARADWIRGTEEDETDDEEEEDAEVDTRDASLTRKQKTKQWAVKMKKVLVIGNRWLEIKQMIGNRENNISMKNCSLTGLNPSTSIQTKRKNMMMWMNSMMAGLGAEVRVRRTKQKRNERNSTIIRERRERKKIKRGDSMKWRKWRLSLGFKFSHEITKCLPRSTRCERTPSRWWIALQCKLDACRQS